MEGHIPSTPLQLQEKGMLGLICLSQIPARALCPLFPKPPVDAQLLGDMFLPDLWDFSITPLIWKERAVRATIPF